MSLQAVRRPISQLPILAKISVPGSPDWVAVSEDAIWISNIARDNITRIDPRTNTVVANVAVGREPCSGLGLGFGSVWVPCCGDARVDRVDVATNKVVASIAATVASSEGAIAVGPSGVWLPADKQGTVVHIDPATNTIVGSVKTAPGSFAATAGDNAIWVTSTEHDLLSRIDPTIRQVTAQIAVGSRPHFLAVGEGAVWTLNQGDGTVSRVDPATNNVIATIEAEIPGTGGDIAAGEGFIWLTSLSETPTGKPLTKIDPATNKVVVQFVGRGGDALRVGNGAIWMCSFFLQEVWHVSLQL
jgi:virginiamycin B lyase